jgi:hypothetical protein
MKMNQYAGERWTGSSTTVQDLCFGRRPQVHAAFMAHATRSPAWPEHWKEYFSGFKNAQELVILVRTIGICTTSTNDYHCTRILVTVMCCPDQR